MKLPTLNYFGEIGQKLMRDKTIEELPVSPSPSLTLLPWSENSIGAKRFVKAWQKETWSNYWLCRIPPLGKTPRPNFPLLPLVWQPVLSEIASIHPKLGKSWGNLSPVQLVLNKTGLLCLYFFTCISILPTISCIAAIAPDPNPPKIITESIPEKPKKEATSSFPEEKESTVCSAKTSVLSKHDNCPKLSKQ
jgi:hypothetical protein